MCLCKSMGKKDLFWGKKARWRSVLFCCCEVPAAPRVAHGTSSLLQQVCHIPEDESQELGMAQHSLATLADGVLQTPGCSSSPQKCSSGKMQNLQVSRENLSLFGGTKNICEITPLWKTCFTFFGFSSLSPFPCISVYDCSFKSCNSLSLFSAS